MLHCTHCPAGWCIFNDLAVAARAAQRDAGVTRVLLLDLDVHQVCVRHNVLAPE
jgi:acetoin utilization deacetylase AcuC-like enzyme